MTRAGKELMAAAEDLLTGLRADRSRLVIYKIRQRDLDVRAIRRRLGMTQREFSAAFAIPVPTLKKWETKARVPEGPAKAYLTVIEKNPAAVRKALATLPR